MYPIKTRQGVAWVSAPGKIAKNYFKTWFFIDLISILPFDFLGLWLAPQDAGSDTSQLRVFKAIRGLRLIKLVRILRASRILARWESRISASASKLQITKCGIYIL